MLYRTNKYTHTHTHTHTHRHTHTHTHTNTHSDAHAQTRTQTHTHKHTYLSEIGAVEAIHAICAHNALLYRHSIALYMCTCINKQTNKHTHTHEELED